MMLQSYLEQHMEETAVFELFVRKLPPGRNFMVAAGLEQALYFLENIRFSPEELAWLAPRFAPSLIAYLEQFRFNGDVHAMPEGSLFLRMSLSSGLPLRCRKLSWSNRAS